MKKLWLASVVFVALIVSGCCDLTSEAFLDRRSFNLEVGETAPLPKASFSVCNGPRYATGVDRWYSEDPAIALVDAEAGVIKGVAPGETVVLAFISEGGEVAVYVTVDEKTTARTELAPAKRQVCLHTTSG